MNESIIERMTKEELENLLKELKPGTMLTIEMPEPEEIPSSNIELNERRGGPGLADGGNV